MPSRFGIFGLGLAVVALTATVSFAADGYRTGKYLNLDSKALLAPAPIGPSAGFEGKPEIASPDVNVSTPPLAPVTAPTAAAQPTAAAAPAPAVEATPVERVKPAARVARKPVAKKPAQVARKRTNPLDAQAMDTRPQKRAAKPAQRSVQTWPCRSGGICNWQR